VTVRQFVVFIVLGWGTFPIQPTLSIACAEEVNIGVLAPLSGSYAWMGEEVRAGLELAQRHPPHGAKIRVHLLYEDSANGGYQAVTAYRSLIQRGTHIVLSFSSATSMPVAPLANNDKVILIAGATNAEKYSTPHDYTFRVNGRSSYEARFIADTFLQKCAAGPLAIVVVQSDYPMSIWSQLRPELEKRELRPVLIEEILLTEQDYRTLIGRLRQHDVRCVSLLAFHPEAAQFMRQAAEAQLKFGFVLGINSVKNAEFFALGGEAVQGMTITNRRIDRAHPLWRELTNAYGRDLPAALADAYDAYSLAEQALEACGGKADSECLRSKLSSVRDYHGLGGRKSVDEFGDMSDTYELLRANASRKVFEPLGSETGAGWSEGSTPSPVL
jgi:branched-chain amino acid transport system substrate-binding protein